MNASMNDTHNLGNGIRLFQMLCALIDSAAWKLVQVLRGRANISLLKTVRLHTHN